MWETTDYQGQIERKRGPSTCPVVADPCVHARILDAVILPGSLKDRTPAAGRPLTPSPPTFQLRSSTTCCVADRLPARKNGTSGGCPPCRDESPIWHLAHLVRCSADLQPSIRNVYLVRPDLRLQGNLSTVPSGIGSQRLPSRPGKTRGSDRRVCQTRRLLPPDDHSAPRCSSCSVSAKRLPCSISTALTSSISTTYSWGILAGRPLVSRLIESVDCAVRRPVRQIVFKRRSGESEGTASRQLGSCHCLSVSTDQAGQFRSGSVFAKACDRLSGARPRGRVSSTGRQSLRWTYLAA